MEHDVLDDVDRCDAYEVLDGVVDAFHGRLILCPIMYGSLRSRWFAQAASITRGLCLRCQSSDPQTTADGLMEIVEALHLSRSEGSARFRGALRGFEALDLSSLDEVCVCGQARAGWFL